MIEAIRQDSICIVAYLNKLILRRQMPVLDLQAAYGTRKVV